MSITIKHIAKELNLAASTVSKALRDSYEISQETKHRIVEYVKTLDYIPNPYAGSLKNGKTGNIAVVVPDVADSFFSNAINGIDAVAHQKGYHVMVYLTHENPEREAVILRDLRSGRVDGILISVSCGTPGDSAIHRQVVGELPLIFFDRVCHAVEAAKVITDDFESGYQAAEHLLKRGCRRLTFLSTAAPLFMVDQRLEGFKKALCDNGVAFANHHVLACSDQEHERLEALHALMKTEQRPDGVVASVEKFSMQVYAVCHAIGLSIPHDVKVIAFSNLQIAGLLNPSLTTILQPAFEMGKVAAALLFKSLSKKIDLKHEKVILPSTLYARHSTLP